MLPEDTVITQAGKGEEVAEKLKDTVPPTRNGRVRPFIIFLKHAKVGVLGSGEIEKRPFVLDLSTQNGDGMIEHYCINKQWPILAYRLVEEFRDPTMSEETAEGRAVLSSLKPKIEALAGIGSKAIASKDREISSLKAKLEEYEAKQRAKEVPNERVAKEEPAVPAEPVGATKEAPAKKGK